MSVTVNTMIPAMARDLLHLIDELFGDTNALSAAGSGAKLASA